MADTPRVLMVAYHYPPWFGSSGVHRTVKFTRYLPDTGWQPIVLTAHPRAYETTSVQRLAETSDKVHVVRAFALDSRRHLAVRGRSPKILAVPDRWITWWPDAVRRGLRLIREEKPTALWSTFPIATAHLIALTLHWRTGIPWVADFRDPMIEDEYPGNPRTDRVYRWIERHCVASAAFLVFTTESARDLYLKRYPALSADRCRVITNGYDEADFRQLPSPIARVGTVVRLVHSGIVYPAERDPRAFFRALARLKQADVISRTTFALDLRAPGFGDYYGRIIHELGIEDLVKILPPVPYGDALAECASADALVLMQDASCNRQIPAKAYEYLRLGRPILALTSAEGDTAALLRQTGGSTVLDLRDEDAMVTGLPRFVETVREGHHPLPAADVVRGFARHVQAQNLAHLFARLTGPPAASPAAALSR
jgi:glycosyltransferase involved in cell wall biosynthesis